MKFYSHAIEEHQEVPLADDGRLEQIIDYWQQRKQTQAPASIRSDGQRQANHCHVVCISKAGQTDADARMEEICGLVNAQGDYISGRQACTLEVINPKTYMGQGLCDKVAHAARSNAADMLVIDAELSPSQTRNLENQTGMAVCDREAVILNVFLRHARSRSARVQVEIAQLQYLRPRIRGLGLNMDQQAGGIMGSRGPGETASELLARQLDARLAQLKKAAKKLGNCTANQRRARSDCKRISLLGYTNAGKTSLMNALTKAGLSARNLPFETLDTTTRVLGSLAYGNVLISDTVGFIRDLPDRLLASFESTLGEIVESDLLLIVVDGSDPQRDLHLRTTEAILEKLQCQHISRLYFFNKTDKLPRPLTRRQCTLLSGGQPYHQGSSLEPTHIAGLKHRLLSTLSDTREQALFVPYRAKQAMNTVYARCRVLNSQAGENGVHFELQAEAAVLKQLQRLIEGERS